jgi:hypothetical protein
VPAHKIGVVRCCFLRCEEWRFNEPVLDTSGDLAECGGVEQGQDFERFDGLRAVRVKKVLCLSHILISNAKSYAKKWDV